jgi:hypothetical protein
VPLSEHEQRLLEQMERALSAEDPKFASALRGADPRTHYRRRVVKASVGFLVGIALLMTGVMTRWPISVVGFVIMLVSAFLALSSWRQIPNAGDLGVGGGTATRSKKGTPPASATPPSPSASPRSRPRSRGGLMRRLEERWNRRREEGGGGSGR